MSEEQQQKRDVPYLPDGHTIVRLVRDLKEGDKLERDLRSIEGFIDLLIVFYRIGHTDDSYLVKRFEAMLKQIQSND